MDKDEARAILQEHINHWKQLSYEELRSRLERKNGEVIEVKGPSGTDYCLEMEVRWETRPGEAIRVLGSIDDGGLASLLPISADFIVYPEGRKSN
ncbi:MAG: hypothetical protein C5B53_03680 [Candidatus Melainabacteria bacterium]|nr:MAG: hypothetical protein C5B53_03680 [Candidatus Melainabacteria bacterium]